MLSQRAFRTGISTRLDERVYALENCKTMPLQYLLMALHPNLYPVHALDDQVKVYDHVFSRYYTCYLDAFNIISHLYVFTVLLLFSVFILQNSISKGELIIAQPPLLQLSSGNMDRHGAYLLDTGSHMYLWIGAAVSDQFVCDVMGVKTFSEVEEHLVSNNPSHPFTLRTWYKRIRINK